MPFFHIIPISEYWLNLHSCLPLWFSSNASAKCYVFFSGSCLCRFLHPSPFIQCYFICSYVCVYLILRHWFQNARCIWIETENVTFMRFQLIPLFLYSSFCFRLLSLIIFRLPHSFSLTIALISCLTLNPLSVSRRPFSSYLNWSFTVSSPPPPPPPSHIKPVLLLRR